MEYQTRRERREAERAAEQSSEAEKLPGNSEHQDSETASTPEPIAETRGATEAEVDTQQGSRPLTRRELRKLEAQGKSVENTEQPIPQSQLHEAEENPDQGGAVEQVQEIPTEVTPVDNRGGFQESDSEQLDQFTGKNYLYQESSNTFTLDAIPDSLSNGDEESIITNSESIAVVTDSQPSFASDMDDLRFDMEDHQDTVAGKISLVDPVSAKLVAESREAEMVVPGKIVVRNRLVSIGFGVLATVLFSAAGIGLWWVLTEMDVFS